jgi:FAD-dependent urate hydroxylase
MTRPVVIVGAGPFGLSVAACLRARGIETLTLGGVMEFWQRHMPHGMKLRSPLRATHIAEPSGELTLARFAREQSVEISDPIRIEDFIEYGKWFRRTFVPDVDSRRVDSIDLAGTGFAVRLEDDEELEASRVVVAAGIQPFPRCPMPLASLPAELVSHSVDHDDLRQFEGRRVVVVGGGQSAIESAALLHEGGAEVEVIARSAGIRWLGEAQANGWVRRQIVRIPAPPTGVGGRASGWIAAAPDVFRRMPARLQPTISYRCIRPAAAGWLRQRTAGLRFTMRSSIVAAEAANGGVRLELDDGSERTADHVLLGTGYQIDVGRYSFLRPELLARINVAQGYPRLGPGLESSVTGLHFVGAPAAMSFGPIMRFVVGSWYAAPAVARRIAGERQPPLRLSF